MLRLDLSMAVPDVLASCDRARPQKNVAIICAIRRQFPQDSASARPRAWPKSVTSGLPNEELALANVALGSEKCPVFKVMIASRDNVAGV
jgi:hypothetical protein